MKNQLLLLSLILGCGCAKNPQNGIRDLASSNLEQSVDEPAGLPDDLDHELEVMHSKPTKPGGDFAASSEVVKLANGPAQIWDGCDLSAKVRGGYESDTKCGIGYFHPDFVEHLNTYFFPCIERAALSANFPQPSRVFIRHLGTYVNRNGRNSSTLSMHAYARAIDLAKLNLFDTQGTLTPVKLTMKDYSGANAKFYDSFRECWKDTLPTKCTPNQREYKGSIGHPKSALGGNGLHTAHIHLSFPLCAN